MAKENLLNLTGNYGDMLIVEQVAEYLDISKKTVYKLIKERKIKAKRVGREWRIPASRLMDYLAS